MVEVSDKRVTMKGLMAKEFKDILKSAENKIIEKERDNDSRFGESKLQRAEDAERVEKERNNGEGGVSDPAQNQNEHLKSCVGISIFEQDLTKIKKKKPSIVVQNFEDHDEDYKKVTSKSKALLQEAEKNTATDLNFPELKKMVSKNDTQSTVLTGFGKQFWTENDETMRLTKTGMNYDQHMSNTLNKHSKRTYNTMIQK